MKKLFLQSKIRELDRLTIQRQGISSLDLMERAAMTVSDWILHNLTKDQKVAIVAGPGNNGGDGLVVARHLALVGCMVDVYSYVGRNGQRSADCQANMNRLTGKVSIFESVECIDFSKYDIIVDALFGTGVNRPVEGMLADVICQINDSCKPVLSIDMPSGLGDEESVMDNGWLLDGGQHAIVRATWTITFQMPKIVFLMPEVQTYVGEWVTTDIGLDSNAVEQLESYFRMTDEQSIRALLKRRSKFAHKGDAGRAMIIAGSKGMMGAAQLAARGCMRSGVGLLTMAIPEVGYNIMQLGVPEAMAKTSGDNVVEWSEELFDERLDAVAIGPGLGRGEKQRILLGEVLDKYRNTSLVIDADALFNMGRIYDVARFTTTSILTPHEAEFDRLTERHSTRMTRIMRARQVAQDKNCVIVLKGAFTAVCLPDGLVFFNNTGNAGMATGGSGDVLTGVLTALLAQGYSAVDAAIVGTYFHGMAGDMARDKYSELGMTAADISDELRSVWKCF